MRSINEIKSHGPQTIPEYLALIDRFGALPYRRSQISDALVDALREIFTDARLAEMCDAERDGRRIVLPCKVGDTVWTIKAVFSYYSKPYEERIERIMISSDGILFCCVSGHKFSPKSIGKSVFLNYESAEAALTSQTPVSHP